MVLGVADIDRATRSDDGAVRAAEPGRRGWAAIAFGAFASASDRLDDAARGIDAADRVVFGIDDQNVAAGIEGELLGSVEHSVFRRTAVAPVAARAGAGDGGDDPGARIDGSQSAALALEDIDRADRRDLDRAGAEHTSASGGADQPTWEYARPPGDEPLAEAEAKWDGAARRRREPSRRAARFPAAIAPQRRSSPIRRARRGLALQARFPATRATHGG